MQFPEIKKLLSLPSGSKKKEVELTPLRAWWLTTIGTVGDGVLVKYNNGKLLFQNGDYVFIAGIKSLTVKPLTPVRNQNEND